MIAVPEPFARSTIAREGEAGRDWINALPQLVREACARWDLSVVGPVMHGYLAVVVPVRRGPERAALKVSWLDRYSAHEAVALRAWAGHGAVRLLDSLDDEGVLLLEWLDPERSLEKVDLARAVPAAGGLLRRLAIDPPPELRTVSAELDGLRTELRQRWTALGRPFSSRLLDYVVEVASQPPSDPGAVLVNEDLHFGNVLGGDREEWLAIDPKPVAGELEFGVAQLLWTRFDALDSKSALDRRLTALQEAAGFDLERARDLSAVRTVDYWLWALEQGSTEDPGRCGALLNWLLPGIAS